jgi:hypothetical protein
MADSTVDEVLIKKDEFSEVRGSKVPQPLRSSARVVTIVMVLADDRNGPGRIRCEELLLAVATCYSLDFREFLA